MRDMPFEKVKEVAEALRCALVMSENIAETVYGRDDVSTAAADEIAQDAVIVAGRIRAIETVIKASYPGFEGILTQVTREAEARARSMQDKGII